MRTCSTSFMCTLFKYELGRYEIPHRSSSSGQKIRKVLFRKLLTKISRSFDNLITEFFLTSITSVIFYYLIAFSIHIFKEYYFCIQTNISAYWRFCDTRNIILKRTERRVVYSTWAVSWSDVRRVSLKPFRTSYE